MTREHLVKAIYDNPELWSCPKSGFCYEVITPNDNSCEICASEQLAEYEKSIQISIIEAAIKLLVESDAFTLIGAVKILRDMKEKLEEKNND